MCAFSLGLGEREMELTVPLQPEFIPFMEEEEEEEEEEVCESFLLAASLCMRLEWAKRRLIAKQVRPAMPAVW